MTKKPAKWTTEKIETCSTCLGKGTIKVPSRCLHVNSSEETGRSHNDPVTVWHCEDCNVTRHY